MSDIQRVKKVIKWLIYQGIAENESDLSTKMGYTKSSFSQIINGKVNISDKFIDKLCNWDKNINKVWIKRGEGSLFLKNDSINVSELVKEKKAESRTLEVEKNIERGYEMNLINRLLEEKERVIQEKERMIQEKERVIQEKERLIQEKERIIQEKDKTILEKDKLLIETENKLNLLTAEVNSDEKSKKHHDHFKAENVEKTDNDDNKILDKIIINSENWVC